MDIKKYFSSPKVAGWLRSKTLVRALIGVGIAAAVLVVFLAGVSVGYHKAAFSFRMGDNYYRAFGEGGRGRPMGWGQLPDELPGAHGAAGRIIKVDLPTFLLEGPDRIEKTVLIKDDTVIRRFRDTLAPADLKADDYAVVIGSPNDQAQIEAKFIRLMPPPPDDRSDRQVR